MTARAWLKKLGPPLVVFLLARGVLAMTATVDGLAPFAPETLARYDSGQYLSIVERGYEIYPCRKVSWYDRRYACGNTAWFPAYPGMIRLLGDLDFRPVAAAVLLSALFHFATLVLLWNRFLGAALDRGSLLSLLFAAFFPGYLNHHAVFPVSTFMFFALLFVHFLRDRQALAAGAAGMVATLAYPPGIMLVPVAAASLLNDERPWRDRFSTLLLTPGLIALGFASALLVQYLAVGEWLAFFDVQTKYAHGLHEPVHSLAVRIAPLLQEPTNWADSVPALQSLLVLILAALLIRDYSMKPYRDDDLLLACFSLALWVFPLVVGGDVSSFRSESLLLPSAVLTRRLASPVQAGLVVAAVLLSAPIALMFYRYALM